MVMAGSGERVVFVFGRPGDEVLSSGGTIARLRSEGGEVAVLFTSIAEATMAAAARPGEREAVGDPEARDTVALQAAMDALDVRDWRILHAASDAGDGGDHIEDALTEVVDRVKATAVVIGVTDIQVIDAANRVAGRTGIPLFLATRMSTSHAERLTAIDITEFVEEKLRALSAYASRWTVQDHGVVLSDGTMLAVTGYETYFSVHPPHPARSARRPTVLGRLGESLAALSAGVTFGVLGTIGHQSTVAVGSFTIPVGLILALGGAAALLVGLRLLLGDRLVVLFCSLGMLGTIFLLSLRSTGGSVLIPAGLPGTLWSVAPTLVAALVLGWPKLPARR